MADVGQWVRLPSGQSGVVIGHRGDVPIVSRDIDHETEEVEERKLTPIRKPTKR